MVQIAVPSILAAQAEGTRRFEVEAETVGDALHALPVDDLIFNERGELNRHLNVYIDGTDHRERGGLDSSAGGRAGDPRRRDGLRRVATSASRTHTGPLVGRSDECAALDRLLADAQGRAERRRRRCAARPGRGRPHSWTTPRKRADGCRVVRAVGVESEMELPFAGSASAVRARCWIASSGCRRRSATRSRPPSA